MKFTKFFCLIAFFALTISGCSDDDPVTPPSGPSTVNGRVTDLIGGGINGVTVIIGDQTAVTAVDGSFTIGNVTTPYTAKILLASGPNQVGIVYEGVSTTTPTFFGTGMNSSPSTAKLTVSIPALGPNQQAQIFFADDTHLNYSNTITSPETSDSLRIYWNGSGNLTGKIVVLVYTFAGGQIVTYDKYGEKLNYVLTNGSTVSESFTNAELSTNPGETTVSGTIIPPGGYTTPKANILIKFAPNGSAASGARMDNEILSAAYTFVVPTGLPSSFTIGIEGRSSGTLGENNQKLITVNAGTSGNNVNLIASGNLSSPTNGATNIDTNTNFTFNSSSGGVTLIAFSSPGRSFIVITGSTSGSAKIPSFSAYGLGLGSNINYSWGVTRFPTLSSVDAFVSAAPYANVNFTEVSSTESRNFTSVP